VITTNEGLQLALQQLGRVYEAIASLNSEYPNASPSWKAVLTEGWIDQLRQLQREIEEYLGVPALDRNGTAPVEDHVGELREIDLDKRELTVRNAEDVREVRCTFDDSLLEAAKEALDRRVKVSGTRQLGSGRKVSPTLHVFRLEVLEEPAPDAEAATR
jgi:hypothetical protein